jgi:hypothetical protein
MSIDTTQSSHQHQGRRIRRTLTRLATTAAIAGALTGGIAGTAQASSNTESPTPRTSSATAMTDPQASPTHALSSSTVLSASRWDVAPGECVGIPTYVFDVNKIEVTNLGSAPTHVWIYNPVTGGYWPQTIAPGDTWHEAGHYWGIELLFCNDGPSPVHVYSH